jgi:two-component sensor histidine kinase
MEPSRIVPTRSAAGLLLAALGLAGSGQAGRAQAIDGAWGPPPAAEPAVAMAPDGGGAAARLALGQALGAAPLHVLRSAEEGARDQLDALRAWNAAGKRPLKNGFARPLPAVLEARFDSPPGGPGAAAVPLGGGVLAEAEPGWLAWGTQVKVTGAHRLRLHLTAVHLPAGTRMYVAAPGQTPEGFGLELLAPGGDLWTPSVLGESALLEVDVPAAALATHPPSGFAIREVMEIVDLAGGSGGIGGIDGAKAASTSCLLDARCETDADLPHIDNYRHAVAQLIFTVPGQGSFLCTGSLLNDVASDGIPYLLTANHCISDQATASSLQAFFDFYTATCNGTPPAESGRPHSNGSTLLATASADASSDYTLLKLNSVPAGRFFLGWNADPNALQADTALYRISYPAPAHFPQPQSYTQYTYDAAFSALAARVPPGLDEVRGQLQSLLTLANETQGTVREIAAKLRPTVLDSEGLDAAVEWLAADFRTRTGIPCELALRRQSIAAGSELSTALFRILQEALTNVARHAGASRVEVSLAAEGGQAVLEVRDDGRGIAAEEASFDHSLGLLGMDERARALGGRIEIQGEAGRGTTLRASIPLRRHGEPGEEKGLS